jgi:4-amino-4-deoxy-L-arabinose transferase-like glycosyltransferase
MSTRAFWGIAAVALLVRLAVLAINYSHPQALITVSDSGSYLKCGASLAAHGGIVGDDGRPAWGRPPGYPAFLALTFVTGLAAPDRLAGALALQAIVSALAVALAARAASVLGGRAAGLLAGAILVVEPSGISYSDLVLSETLYAFALMGAVITAWRWLTGSGLANLTWFALLIALLPLIRPVALYLPWLLLPIVAWSAPRPLRLKAAVLFLVIALLPSAAWSERNRLFFGAPFFDQTGPLGKAIFARQVEIRAVPEVAAEGTTWTGNTEPWQRYYSEKGPLPTPQAMDRQASYFREMLLKHPVAAFVEWAYTGMTMMVSPDSWLQAQLSGSRIEFEEGGAARLRWLLGTGWLLPLILFGMGVSIGGVLLLPVFAWSARTASPPLRWFTILMVTVIVYHVILSSFIRYQAERYRVPIIPCLAIVLAVGALVLVTAARRRQVD